MLYDASEVHDGYVIGEVTYHAQVMADKELRQV